MFYAAPGTKIVVVAGDPITHSRSPDIHNAWFEENNIDCTMVPVRVTPDRLREFTRALRSPNVLGASITMPLKQAIIPYLDGLDASAEFVGAVNLVRKDRRGRLVGKNSDYDAVICAGSLICLPWEGTITIAGAGGAGRAAAHGLVVLSTRKFYFLSRTLSRARRLRDDFSSREIPGLEEGFAGRFTEANLRRALAHSDLVVHATPTGMPGYPERIPGLEPELAKPGAILIEFVYPETPLQRAWLASGRPVLSGEALLTLQAQSAFVAWTGITPDGRLGRFVQQDTWPQRPKRRARAAPAPDDKPRRGSRK